MECMHQLCTCQHGNEYCSDYCREQGATPPDPSVVCGCGHPECVGTLS